MLSNGGQFPESKSRSRQSAEKRHDATIRLLRYGAKLALSRTVAVVSCIMSNMHL